MKKLSILLVALVLIMLAGIALAANTAPYSLDEAENQSVSIRSNGKVSYFPMRRFYHGVSATEKWVYQTRLNGTMINLQLYQRNGEGILFQENVGKASDGETIRLTLRQENNSGNLLLQMDQEALDFLEKMGISEIAVVDYDFYIQNIYPLTVLNSVRAMLDLKAGEELCVSGMDDPISVVDENGVRRIISE